MMDVRDPVKYYRLTCHHLILLFSFPPCLSIISLSLPLSSVFLLLVGAAGEVMRKREEDEFSNKKSHLVMKETKTHIA